MTYYLHEIFINQVETCQEKIISLELEDPTPPITPSDDEAHSIITIRNNGRDVIQLMPDADQTTFDLQNKMSFDKTALRTIYEMFPNESSTDPVEASTDADAACVDDYTDASNAFSSFDEHFPDPSSSQQLELSLNDKMKNVLRELKQNERVRLSWSRSMTEAELEEFNKDEVEDMQSFEEKTGSNGTVFMVRERLINDFYSHNTDDSVGPIVATSFDPNDNFDQGFADSVDGCSVFENPGAFLDLERSQTARERLTLDLKTIKDEINVSKILERDTENNEVEQLVATPDTDDAVTPTTPTSVGGGSQRNNRKKKRGKNKKK